MRILTTMALTAGLAACATLASSQRGPGERLLRSKCGACHLRPEPARFDRAGWERVLDTHAERVPLEAEQRAQLLDHLAGATTDAIPD